MKIHKYQQQQGGGIYDGGNPIGEGQEIVVKGWYLPYQKLDNGNPLDQASTWVQNQVRNREPYKPLLGLAFAPAVAYAAPMVYKIINKLPPVIMNRYSTWAAAHPAASGVLTVANVGSSAASLASDNGLKKTYNLIKNREYGRAAISGANDLVDAIGIGNFAKSTYKGLPWNKWFTGLGRTLTQTGSLAANSYFNMRNAWQYTKPVRDAAVKLGIPLWDRIKFNAQIAKDIFKKDGTFLRDMKIFTPWDHTRFAFMQPIDPCFLQKNLIINNPYLDVYDVINSTEFMSDQINDEIKKYFDNKQSTSSENIVTSNSLIKPIRPKLPVSQDPLFGDNNKATLVSRKIK